MQCKHTKHVYGLSHNSVQYCISTGIFVYFLCVKNYGLNVYLGTITSINGELYCIFIENEKQNKTKTKDDLVSQIISKSSYENK